VTEVGEARAAHQTHVTGVKIRTGNAASLLTSCKEITRPYIRRH
jgi:hypothetical protein